MPPRNLHAAASVWRKRGARGQVGRGASRGSGPSRSAAASISDGGISAREPSDRGEHVLTRRRPLHPRRQSAREPRVCMARADADPSANPAFHEREVFAVVRPQGLTTHRRRQPQRQLKVRIASSAEHHRPSRLRRPPDRAARTARSTARPRAEWADSARSLPCGHDDLGASPTARAHDERVRRELPEVRRALLGREGAVHGDIQLESGPFVAHARGAVEATLDENGREALTATDAHLPPSRGSLRRRWLRG